MERIEKILNHDLFKNNLQMNREAEADRKFCRHDMVHFLDVARIATILALKENLLNAVVTALPDTEKLKVTDGEPESVILTEELIYVAALLHDIGKHMQYTKGIPHEKASAVVAAAILKECGFKDKETCVIIAAIDSHRNETVADEKNLRGLLYRADKLSRPCFACAAEKECNWKDGKKNLTLKQ